MFLNNEFVRCAAIDAILFQAVCFLFNGLVTICRNQLFIKLVFSLYILLLTNLTVMPSELLQFIGNTTIDCIVKATVR